MRGAANTFDVMVLGAGIVGCACARECAQTGLLVGVVEPGVVGGGATAAGMGHLVVMDDSPAQLALTSYSRSVWKELAAQLPPADEYEATGTVWVAADAEEMDEVREILDDRLTIFVGVDDVLVEGVSAGAQGWVAGLVNAFPAESVELFNLARAGRHEEAFALYRWFLPLLRMDTVPKSVQLIKWVQGETGTGSAAVRAPRLELAGAELAEAQQVLKTALANRPGIHSTTFLSLQEA